DSSRSRQPPPGTVFGFSGPGFALFQACLQAWALAACTALGGRPLCWLTEFSLPTSSLGPTRSQRLQMARNGRCNTVDRGHAIHTLEHASAGIIVDQWRCLCPVGGKAPLEHFRVVIRADLFTPSSHFGRALLDALKKNALIHLQLHDRIELKTSFGQQT